MKIKIGADQPVVDESAWVAPTATLIGRVTVGPEAGIWYNAVLRGDMDSITVGARSNIQDGCVLHADPGFPLTVGQGVSVGHNATLHGCTIGDDVLVGMGATVLNGASVGAGTLIAANALVPQGAEIPPNSLVAGVPAKVRRELTPPELDMIKVNSAVYVHSRTVHADATEV